MDRLEVPDADRHTGYCRAYAWRWRFTVPAHQRDSPTGWPCQCRPVVPWTMVERPHPAWCQVPGEHRWHDCALPSVLPPPKE